MLEFCCRTAIEDIVLKWWGLGPDEAERHEKCRRLIETISWFALTLILAAVIPNIGVAISLIGGIAALFIFVFPGLTLYHLLMVYSCHLIFASHIRTFLVAQEH